MFIENLTPLSHLLKQSSRLDLALVIPHTETGLSACESSIFA